MNYLSNLKMPNLSREEMYIYISVVVGILLLIGLIILGVTVNKKARDNGASWLQIYTGKPIGAVCANNGMCSTNKCVSNICLV